MNEFNRAGLSCVRDGQVDALSLSHCDFSDDLILQGLLHIAASPVKKLDLSATRFASRKDFSKVLSALHANPLLEELNLSNRLCCDYLDEDGSLGSLLRFSSKLQRLDLSGHTFSADVLNDLIGGLKNSKALNELRLRNCSLDERAVSAILSTVPNLRVLDLSSNKNFSPAFLNSTLATYLIQNKKLKYLLLDHLWSMFGVQDAAVIRPFLQALEKNTSVTSISLRCCRLSENVGEAILTTLTVNETITEIDLELSGFGLRDQGNKILIQLLPKFKSLQQLKIVTFYPPKLVPQLVCALTENCCLRVFQPRLSGSVGDEKTRQLSALQGILERNKKLALAKSLLPPMTEAPPALMPKALALLSKSSAGSHATFHVLQHLIVDCI